MIEGSILDKLKIRGNKKSPFFAIALILMLAASTFAVLPLTVAHDPGWNVPTFAYITASPSNVAVGEYTVLVMWLNAQPPTAGGLGGDLWHGFMINVTAPDGTQSQLGPFTSGTVGGTWTTFTPTQVGNYTMVFYFSGQIAGTGTGTANYREAAYVGDYFEPSVSAPMTLVVTQTSAPGWQEPQVPTGYWTTPINAANREWSSLASNWLSGSWLVNNFQSAGKAPNSPHIVWQIPLTLGYAGGIADAQWPGIPYDVDDYETAFSNPIIINGILYYNTPNTASTPRYGYYAVDLKTGQQLWYKNGTDNGLDNAVRLVGYASGANTAPELSQTVPLLSFGQLYKYDSLNGQGISPYLWMTVGSTWYMLDSSTGNWIMTLTNVPGGTSVTDQDGSLLKYSYDPATGTLLCWNSSQAIPPAGPTGTSQQQWKPRVGATINAVNDTTWTDFGPRTDQWTAADILPRSGYTMNVTIPAGLPTVPRADVAVYGTSQGIGGLQVVQDDNRVPQYIVYFDNPTAVRQTSGNDGNFYAWAVKINYHDAQYSPYPNETYTQNNNLGYTATLLWNESYMPMSGNLTFSPGPISYDAGIWTVFSKETMQWWGYSLTTGQLVWGPTPSENSWDMYGDSVSVAYGNLYTTGYGGVLYCYNMSTGALQWAYAAQSVGRESPYGDNYPLTIGAISDGKVFLYSTEHSPTKPLWRGSSVRAINAYTGTELWKIQDFNMALGVADGYLISGNEYNNMIECYGTGQSATTVTATPKVANTGSTVLIEGTVTDQSPGQTCLGVPAAGTPAIADQYMEQWMEYLYMQQAEPIDATGVSVTLTAVTPSGDVDNIGSTTSDITGSYAFSWTPPSSGIYTIVASFDGSNSYYSSSAETHIAVGSVSSEVSAEPTSSAGPTSSSPSPIVASPANAAPAVTYVAVASVIILIVVAVAAVILRRRTRQASKN